MASRAQERLLERFGSAERIRAHWKEQRTQRMKDPLKVAEARECRRRTKSGKRKLWTKARLVLRARARARELGLEATITAAELYWPTHCPVLGTELSYAQGDRTKTPAHALPSLDRWDNSKGYVRGNVYIISFRANSLKSNATLAELRAVLDYAEHGVW